MCPSSTRRRRGACRHRPAGVLVALAVAAVAVLAWRTATASRLPVAGLTNQGAERAVWVGPGIGPLAAVGDLEAAEVVFVGDSRVGHAVHLAAAADAGLERAAVLFGFGVRAEDALCALAALEGPRSVVVGVSPLGLVGHTNRAVAETLREHHPAFDAERPPHEVRGWAKAERGHLVARGFTLGEADQTLAWWREAHARARADLLRRARVFDTSGFDSRLAELVDRTRSLALNPLEPTEWHRGWWDPARPHASDGFYRAVLTPAGAPEREAAAVRLAAALRALADAGWRVATVRLPLEPGLRGVEDEAGLATLLAGVAERASLPYLDLGSEAGCSSDGQHLHWPAADRATRALVRWLRDDLGWDLARP